MSKVIAFPKSLSGLLSGRGKWRKPNAVKGRNNCIAYADSNYLTGGSGLTTATH
jgi:hypothetical protein